MIVPRARETTIPANAAIITAPLLYRPTCSDCIHARTDLSPKEIDNYLTAIATRLELHRVIGRCRVCGNTGPVFSLHLDAA